MPVDKQLLDSCIDEAAGGDPEIKALLAEKFGKNEQAAVAFTAGFTRTRDYTQKTTALADQRKDMEKLGQTLKQYQDQLEASETEKAKILKDLANQKVTVAGANARLSALKEKYALDDEDIPPMGDLIDTRKSGRVVDNTPDIETRLADFRKDIVKEISDKLVPELSGMTQLDIIWSEIGDEHRELTGKRLTAKERGDILAEARNGNKSLTAVWESKYEIPKLRKDSERETWRKEERAKWDAEQTAKRSEEAMQGIRPGAADETGLRLSPVLKHEFKERGVDPTPPEGGKPGEHVRRTPSSEQRESLTGAERAAKRFMERRAAGVPMGGKEPPAGKTA